MSSDSVIGDRNEPQRELAENDVTGTIQKLPVGVDGTFHRTQDLGSAASRLPFGWDDDGSGELNLPSASKMPSAVGRPGVRAGAVRRRGRIARVKPFNRPAAAIQRREANPGSTPGERARASIRYLADLGRAVAGKLGYPCVVEEAGGSESTYLHIEREGWWYGIRISTHPPAYACSYDYEPLLLPVDRIDVDRAEFESRVRHLAASGGWIVASPAEVQRSVDQESLAMRQGCSVNDGQMVWRFDADRVDWVCVGRSTSVEDGVCESLELDQACDQTEALDQTEPLDQPDRFDQLGPPWIPTSHLSAAQIAAIRHRCHWREKWSASQCGVEPSRIGLGGDPE